MAKVALITGAARGIGAAAAIRFGKDGYKVVAADVAAPNETVQAITAAGGEAVAVTGDVSQPADCEAMVKAAVDTFGRLDVVCHIAGITRDAFAHKMTLDQWNAVIAVNLTGSFLIAQAAAAAMRDQGSGCIILTSSAPGLRGNMGQANYSATKAGVVGLTRTLALEYARFGVRVNAIAPGATVTPMTATIPDKVREQIEARIPLKRFAQPEELAAAYALLASDDAAYITGQTLMVDGGLTIGV